VDLEHRLRCADCGLCGASISWAGRRVHVGGAETKCVPSSAEEGVGSFRPRSTKSAKGSVVIHPPLGFQPRGPFRRRRCGEGISPGRCDARRHGISRQGSERLAVVLIRSAQCSWPRLRRQQIDSATTYGRAFTTCTSDLHRNPPPTGIQDNRPRSFLLALCHRH
jgi:hypothetical protein